MKRRLILPTVLGVVALGSAVVTGACEGNTPDPSPDGILPSDATFPIPSADGPIADATMVPDAGVDAFVPLDAPPDTHT